MQQNQPPVVELLHTEGAEVYQIQQGNIMPLVKGPLSLIFEQKHQWVLLKIAGFTYGLSKGIPVLCSTREKGVFRTYILPGPDCFYAIKVVEVWSRAELSRLDEILKENSSFVHKEDFNAYVDSLPNKPREQFEPQAYQPVYTDPNPQVQQDFGNTYDAGNKQVREQEFLTDLSSKMASLRGETIKSRTEQNTKVDYVERLRPETEPDRPVYGQQTSSPKKKAGVGKSIAKGFKKMGSIFTKPFSKKKKEKEFTESNVEYSLNNNLTRQAAVTGTAVDEDPGEIKRAMGVANQISSQITKDAKKNAKEQGYNIQEYERKGLMTHVTVCKSFDTYNGMMDVMGRVLAGQ